MPLMDKPFGWTRSPQQVARNLEALQLLQAGALREGELFSLVTGVPLNQGKVTEKVERRGLCKDCRLPLLHAGPQLAQQNARCRTCASKHRSAVNAAARPRKSEVSSEPVGERHESAVLSG